MFPWKIQLMEVRFNSTLPDLEVFFPLASKMIMQISFSPLLTFFKHLFVKKKRTTLSFKSTEWKKIEEIVAFSAKKCLLRLLHLFFFLQKTFLDVTSIVLNRILNYPNNALKLQSFGLLCSGHTLGDEEIRIIEIVKKCYVVKKKNR